MLIFVIIYSSNVMVYSRLDAGLMIIQKYNLFPYSAFYTCNIQVLHMIYFNYILISIRYAD